jgi:hypothetical protein
MLGFGPLYSGKLHRSGGDNNSEKLRFVSDCPFLMMEFNGKAKCKSVSVSWSRQPCPAAVVGSVSLSKNLNMPI